MTLLDICDKDAKQHPTCKTWMGVKWCFGQQFAFNKHSTHGHQSKLLNLCLKMCRRAGGTFYLCHPTEKKIQSGSCVSDFKRMQNACSESRANFCVYLCMNVCILLHQIFPVTRGHWKLTDKSWASSSIFGLCSPRQINTNYQIVNNWDSPSQGLTLIIALSAGGAALFRQPLQFMPPKMGE